MIAAGCFGRFWRIQKGKAVLEGEHGDDRHVDAHGDAAHAVKSTAEDRAEIRDAVVHQLSLIQAKTVAAIVDGVVFELRSSDLGVGHRRTYYQADQRSSDASSVRQSDFLRRVFHHHLDQR